MCQDNMEGIWNLYIISISILSLYVIIYVFCTWRRSDTGSYVYNMSHDLMLAYKV